MVWLLLKDAVEMRWIQQNFPVLRKHKKWAFGSTFIAISCKLFIVFNYIASNNLLNDFVFPGNCSGNTQNISLYLGVTYKICQCFPAIDLTLGKPLLKV